MHALLVYLSMLLYPVRKLGAEAAGAAVCRMAHDDGCKTCAGKHRFGFTANGADGNVRTAKSDEIFRIRQACCNFVICRCAIAKRRSLMGMEGKDVPQDDIPRVQAVVDDGAPHICIGRFIHADEALGLARHIWAVRAACPFSRPAQDHGARNLLMLIKEHPLTCNGNACEAASLIAGGFSDEEVFGSFETGRKVVLKLLPPYGWRLWRDVTACIVIMPRVEGLVARIGL